ncbi:copper homeostasis protein CutC [Actinomycetota bacterium]|nr:copper homeostasis protein CutC [Actinomycetota bacterium]
MPASPADRPADHALPTVEIAVQDPAGALVAAAGGAARVELCSALAATGGITPSAGLLAAVLAVLRAGDGGPGGTRPGGRHLGVHVGVHVLVRPRPGGFVYTADELDVQVRDVEAAVAAGAEGVVVGALTADGRVDTAAVRRFVAAAAGREVTFHRAFDVLDDRLAGLDVLAELGVTRVLSSGGEERCIDGVRELAVMVAHTAGAVQVMAGGGLRPPDISAMVAAGVDAVHLSASRAVPGDGGPGGGGGAGHTVTDPELVRAAADALRAAAARV